MDEEQVLQALVQAAPGIRNGNYAYLASMVLFLYDWAISFDQEVKYFWKKKLSVGGWLYFANRFVSVLLLLIYSQATLRSLDPAQSDIICFPLLYVIASVAALSTTIVQAVLILRTYALWDCSTKILYSLMFINIGGFATQMVVMGLNIGTRTIVVYNPLPTPYTGCVALAADWLYQRYIPILAVELPAAALTLLKFAQYFKSGRGSQVAFVLYRDGFLEFATVAISSIFGLIVELVQPAGGVLFTASLNIVAVLAQVCCARMLLNIRDVMSMSNRPPATTPTWPGPVPDGFMGSGRQTAASVANGEGNRNQNHRSGHEPLNSFGAGLGIESWEMHRVSELRHAMQLQEPVHFDEEPIEVKAGQNIIPGVSREDTAADTKAGITDGTTAGSAEMPRV